MADVSVNLSFTADTTKAKAQLQDLQNTLSNLTNNAGKKSTFPLTDKIVEATHAASELKYHLEQATNVKTGNLDFQKLNASFKESGMTLADYGKKLMALGPEGQQAFSKLISSVSAAEIPIKRANSKLQELAVTLKNTAKWQISSSLLHGFIGAIQSAYGYAQDLNRSLNDIRIVTGYGVDKMAQFAQEANKAAKALSTSTTKYTDASLIYYQQGLNDQQVKERTDVTIKMANVARESAVTVSDQMTAVWNNFDDGSKSLEYFADVMTKLGADTAASVDEIAQGIEKFSAISKTVGLSYEYATAALTTVVDRTRQSADVVGTAFKTMFARIQGLKLGETLEDGTTLNQYSQALKAVGINIKESNGELKDMDVILDEMGAKWKELNRDEQVALAQKVAGVRQYQQLVSLMENYDFFKQNVDLAYGSTGALQEQADIYAESWEAAQKRVKASAETIYGDLLNDKGFISILDSTSKILDMIDVFIHQLGGVKGVLATISAIVTTIFEKQLATGLQHAAESLKMMTAAGREAAQQAQQESIADAVEVRYGAAKENAPESEKMARQGYQDLLTVQQQFIDNQDVMSEAQKRAAQDTLTAFRESISVVVEEQEAIENLQAEVNELDLAFLEVAAASAEFAHPGDQEQRLKLLQEMSKELEKFKSEQNIHLGLLDDLEELKDEGADSAAILDQIESKIKLLENQGSGTGILSTLLEEFQDTSEETGTFQQKLAALIAEVKRLKTVSVDEFKDIDSMLIDDKEVDNLVNKLDNLHQKTQQVEEDKKKQADAHVRAAHAMEQEGKSVQTVSQSLVQGMQSISSLFSSYYMLIGLWDTIKDPDTSGIEKFFRVFSTGMMVLPMMISSITSLKKAWKGLTSEQSFNTIANGLNTIATTLNSAAKRDNAKASEESAKKENLDTTATGKNTIEKIKNAFAQKKQSSEGFSTMITKAKDVLKALKDLAGSFAPVIMGIAAVAAAVAAGSAIWNSANREVEKANELANQLTESLSHTTDAYNTFSQSVKSYEDASKSLDNLVAGTEEYKDALFKANEEAMKLIHTYKELKYDVTGEGLIVINPDSLQTLKETQAESLKLAQTTTLLAQEEAKRAEIRVQEQKLNRQNIQSTSMNPSGDQLTSTLSGTGAGAGVGAIIGSSIVPFIGTAVGAVLGGALGALGGVLYGTFNQETSSEKKAIASLAESYKVMGNSIFTDRDTLAQALASGGFEIQDETLIDSLLANKDSVIDLIQATNENTSKLFELNSTLMGDAINDSPVLKGKSETEKKLMASITANQLASKQANSMEVTNFLTSNKNGFFGGLWNFFGKAFNTYAAGANNNAGFATKDYQTYSIKQLRQAYAEEKGYDASLAIDEGKESTKFLDEQGNEIETISNAAMRVIIAQKENQADILKSLEENGPLYDSLFNKLEKFSKNNDIAFESLSAMFGGDPNASLTSFTKEQLTKIENELINGGYFTPEELGLLDLKDGLSGTFEKLREQANQLWESISAEGQTAFGGYNIQTASKLDKISKKIGMTPDELKNYYEAIPDEDKKLFLEIDFDTYKTQENWERQLALLKNKENIVDIKLNISNLDSIKEALENGDYETIKNKIGDYHFADFMNLSPEQQQASLNRGLEQSYIDLYNNANQIQENSRATQLNALESYNNADISLQNASFRDAHQSGELSTGGFEEQRTEATEQYKQATDELNQSLIDEQTALQGLADLYGMDKGELQSLIDAFGSMSDVLADNEGLAAQVANRYMRLQDSVLDLSKNYKTYDEVLKNLKKSSNAVDKAALQNTESYKKLRSSVAGLLGTTEDFINADLLEAIDPADLKKAAAGDEAAIERIRDKFIELQAQIAGLNETDLSGLKKELASLKEGEVFDIDNKPFLKKLIEAQLAAGATAPEIQSLLSGLDIDADVTPFEGSMEEMAAAAAEAGSAVVADTSFDQEVETADVEQKTKGEDIAFEESFIPHPVEMTNSVLENEASDAKTVTTRVWVGNKTVTPHIISEDGTEITPAKSVKTKTAGGKEGNVKGVQIKNAHKSVGSSVSPSTSGTAKQNLGKGSKGGGGGGGGKSTPAEKKDLTKKSDVVERYKKLNDRLDVVNKNMEKYNKLSDQIWGNNKVKVMNKILKNLQQQIKLQQQLKKEAEGYLVEDKKNMETAAADLGTRKLQYDSDGNIKNIEAVQSDIFIKIHAAEEKYNSFATKEQQDEYNKSTLEPLMKQYEEFKNYLSKYEDTRLKIVEIEQTQIDLSIEYANKALEKLNYKIKLKIQFRKDEVSKFEKELEKLENRAFSTAKRFSLLNAEIAAYNKVATDGQKGIKNSLKKGLIKEVEDKNGNKTIITFDEWMNKKGYSDKRKDKVYEKLMNGETPAGYDSLKDFFKDWSFTESGYNDMQEFKESLIEASDALDEIKDTIDNEVILVLNRWTATVEKNEKALGHWTTVFDKYTTIIEKIGAKTLWGDNSNEIMRSIRNQDLNNKYNSLKQHKSNYDTSKTFFEEIEHLGDVQERELSNANKKDFKALMQTKIGQNAGVKVSTYDRATYEENITKLLKKRDAVEQRLLERQKEATYLSGQELEDNLRLQKSDAQKLNDFDQIYQRIEGRNSEIAELEERTEQAREQVRENRELVLDDLIDIIETAQENALADIDAAFTEFEKRVAGSYKTIANMKEAFDLNKRLSDEYLADYEKVYELTKLNRDLEKKMDETSNIKAKEKLAALQEKITNYAAEGVKMSKYDLEYMQKAYDLEVAKIALEEAQNAKSQVRLTRDAEGNYSYTYTADENKMAEAEQSYEDKMNDLLKFSNDYSEKMLEAQLNTTEKMEEALKELAEQRIQGYLTQEEYNKKAADIEAWWTEQYNYYASERDKASRNNTKVFMEDYDTYYSLADKTVRVTRQFNDDLIASYNEAYNEYEKAQIKRDTALDRLNKSYASGAISLQEYLNQFKKINSDYAAETETAETQYKTIMETIVKGNTENATSIKDGMNGIIFDAKSTFLPEHGAIWTSASADVEKFVNALIGENGKPDPNSLLGQINTSMGVYANSVGVALAEIGVAFDIDNPENVWRALAKLISDKTTTAGNKITELSTTVETANTKAKTEIDEAVEKTEYWYKNTYPTLVAAKTNIDNVTTSIDLLLATAAGLTPITPKAETTAAQEKIKELNKEITDLKAASDKAEETITPKADTKDAKGNVDGLKGSYDDMNKSGNTAKGTVTPKADTKGAKGNVDRLKGSYDNLNKSSATAAKTVTTSVKTDTTKNKVDALKKSYDNLTTAAKNAQKQVNSGLDQEPANTGGSTQGDGKLQVGDKVTLLSQGYEDSWGGGKKIKQEYVGTTVKIDKKSSTKVSGGQWSGDVGDYYIHVSTLNGGDLGWVKKSQISGYDTGGYTGVWGRDGRFALLHQKELVLNEQDTQNMLAAVKTVREIAAMVDLQAQQASLAGQYALALGQLPSSRANAIDQNVHITAEFPNVQDHNEVELALTSLVNRASQFAWRN